MAYPRAVSSSPVTLEFKQSVAATETLRAGSYGKGTAAGRATWA